MNFIYDFPKKATYGKVIPKNKIYAYANPKTRIKELFVHEVDKIVWAYKLSTQTLNLPESGFVSEIQIIMIDLKSRNLNYDVLRTIDKAIPSPILFVLRANNKIRYTAAYKRQNEADKSKWVISEYFQSPWMKENKGRQPLPVALNLRILYETMIKNLILIMPLSGESIEEFIARVEQIGVKQGEAEKIQIKMRKEKQYNRKVELHTQLVNLKKEIEAISH
ncbi:MAG: DUF4391 domain-containing protein [Candidatus Caldatribacteriota bacterium]|nr:DUF4391 domain-containing protein [Candidatus Caldatribacteriota bacterium]